MDSLKLKWLSKEVTDKQKFYEFINKNEKWVIDYVANVCYSIRKIKTKAEIEESIYELESTINYSTLRDNRSKEEIKTLFNTALNFISKKDVFGLKGYNESKSKALLMIALDKNLLTNYDFAQQVSLMNLVGSSVNTSDNFVKDKYRTLKIEENTALAQDLDINEKINLIQFMREYYQNHSEDSLYVLEMISKMNFSDLGEEAYSLKKFFIEKICYGQLISADSDIPIGLSAFSMFNNCEERILNNLWGANFGLIYQLIESENVEDFFYKLDVIEKNHDENPEKTYVKVNNALTDRANADKVTNIFDENAKSIWHI